MPTDIAKYSIELFKPGGEGAGIEEILDRHADLKTAPIDLPNLRRAVSSSADHALRRHSGAGPKRSAGDYALAAGGRDSQPGSVAATF
jgi:hypothetical protein